MNFTQPSLTPKMSLAEKPLKRYSIYRALMDAILDRYPNYKHVLKLARLGLILGLNVNIQLQSVAFVTIKISIINPKLVSDQVSIIFWQKEG
jgi:hypothetical protein